MIDAVRTDRIFSIIVGYLSQCDETQSTSLHYCILYSPEAFGPRRTILCCEVVLSVYWSVGQKRSLSAHVFESESVLGEGGQECS